MIIDTLMNELKPSFTADISKGFLLHADKNVEPFCEEKWHNGNENGERICEENLHGDNPNPHIINKLGCSHCLCSIGPEHQHFKIYESLTGKHIKYHNAVQVSQHPSLLGGNHHMSSFPLFTASIL